MKERGIIMSAPMIRALLDDLKTHTRRIVKPQPECQRNVHAPASAPDFWLWRHHRVTEAGYCHTGRDAMERLMIPCCPYGAVGDRLWVRETFAEHDSDVPVVAYKAGGYLIHGATGSRRAGTWRDEVFAGDVGEIGKIEKWTPSIFMPRWASRITLEITAVRVERLQDISEEEAKAEGAPCRHDVFHPAIQAAVWNVYMRNFAVLWDSIHGAGAWVRNDYVWALSFRRIT